jgi:hypothetical protein
MLSCINPEEHLYALNGRASDQLLELVKKYEITFIINEMRTLYE